jgi:hypothetical protein
MDSGQNSSAAESLYVAWHRCVADGQDHAVTDEEFARGRQEHTQGRYAAVCGHVALVGSMLLPPGRVCARCHAYLVARPAQRPVAPQFGAHRHRKPGVWGRLCGHLQTPAVPLPRAENGRSLTPAGAGSAPTAPALAGHHHMRGER